MACPHGAEVKSGVDPDHLVPVDRSLWESVTGAPASWLDPILDTFTQEWIKTSDLCALNLSDPPLPTTADLIAAATNPATIPASLYTWVRDKLRYAQFAQQCVCSSTSGLCHEDFGPTSFNSTVGVSWTPGIEQPIPAWAGVQAWGRVQLLSSGCFTNVDALIQWRDASHAFISNTPVAYGGHTLGPVDTGLVDPPAGAAYATINGRNEDPSCVSTLAMELHFQGTCTPAPAPPTAPTQPTQPPDLTLPPAWSCGTSGDICTRLQQLDQRIRSIQDYVTLIQRQHVPFAYVTGASFTASGQGSHAVQGILGLSVSFTALPSGRSNYPDNPASYFDLGWLTLCTADGCEAARPLHRQQELILDVSPAVTSVRWSLPSGAAATLMPLVREP